MSNPIQEAINGGESPIVAILTNATCGEACWHAVENVCRCKCGGKNHGCLRGPNGVQPDRTARIDGFRYKLAAVGVDGIYAEAKRINDAAPKRLAGGYSYHWSETDAGAPARVRPATSAQVEKWPELTASRDAIAAVKAREHFPMEWMRLRPYLLWVKIDEPVKPGDAAFKAMTDFVATGKIG